MATERKKGGGQAKDAAFFTEVMNLAAQAGWRRTGWSDIAEATGVPLAELHARFGSKQGLLDAFVDHIDGMVLAGGGKSAPDPEDTPKDRLFEVLMRRFDALGPYRDGLGAIVREMGGGGPLDLLCGAGRMLRSMAWMLEAAGLSAAGVRGGMRMNGLGAVYAATFMVWLRDESEDLSKTMAALDRNLDRAGRLAGLGGRRRRHDPPGGMDDRDAGQAPQGA